MEHEKSEAELRREFEKLVKACRPTLIGSIVQKTGSLHNAEDIVQEACRRAWKSYRRFDHRSAFSSWLHRIAINLVIDRYRRSGRFESADDPYETLLLLADPSPNPEELVMPVSEEFRRMMLVMKYLPVQYQQILRLRYLDNLSYEEIATELAITIPAVKGRLNKARARMRWCLGLSK